MGIRLCAVIVFLAAAIQAVAFAGETDTGHDQLRLARIFTSNMVLQRDMKVPVWGWSGPNEKVTVRFAGQAASSIGPM